MLFSHFYTVSIAKFYTVDQVYIDVNLFTMSLNMKLTVKKSTATVI